MNQVHVFYVSAFTITNSCFYIVLLLTNTIFFQLQTTGRVVKLCVTVTRLRQSASLNTNIYITLVLNMDSSKLEKESKSFINNAEHKTCLNLIIYSSSLLITFINDKRQSSQQLTSEHVRRQTLVNLSIGIYNTLYYMYT